MFAKRSSAASIVSASTASKRDHTNRRATECKQSNRPTSECNKSNCTTTHCDNANRTTANCKESSCHASESKEPRRYIADRNNSSSMSANLAPIRIRSSRNVVKRQTADYGLRSLSDATKGHSLFEKCDFFLKCLNLRLHFV